MALITLHGPPGRTTLPSLRFLIPSLNMELTWREWTPRSPFVSQLIPAEDHVCLLLGGPPSQEPGVDDVLNHLSTRQWGWFI